MCGFVCLMCVMCYEICYSFLYNFISLPVPKCCKSLLKFLSVHRVLLTGETGWRHWKNYSLKKIPASPPSLTLHSLCKSEVQSANKLGRSRTVERWLGSESGCGPCWTGDRCRAQNLMWNLENKRKQQQTLKMLCHAYLHHKSSKHSLLRLLFKCLMWLRGKLGVMLLRWEDN